MSKVFSFKENHPTPVTNDHDHSTFTQYYTWQKGENMYMWEKESIYTWLMGKISVWWGRKVECNRGEKKFGRV